MYFSASLNYKQPNQSRKVSNFPKLSVILPKLKQCFQASDLDEGSFYCAYILQLKGGF